MHLPDAFLDTKTVVLSSAFAAAGLGAAVRRLQAALPPRQIPMLGLAGAFLFAAQMLNFPVPGGTSGHLVGGVLIAILLGPSAAVLVMSCVLIVQCLLFADGGLLALGANVFNMGLVSVCGGYAVFQVVRSLFRMDRTRATVFAAGFAGWAGTVFASISCAGQLALSGTAPWGLVFPAMVNIHMVIGAGEGLATALITLAVLRKGQVAGNAILAPPERRPMVTYGLLASLGLAVFVAPFACPWPDGLEHVASALGFDAIASQTRFAAPLSDYTFPWLSSAALATALAGLLGTAVAFAAAYMLARVLVPAIDKGNDAASGT